MTDHTPEPWPDWESLSGSGSHYALDRFSYERARACVNACAGIPTEQLSDAKVIELVQCLAWLDRVGGLGLDKHERIAAALAPFRKDKP